MNQWFKKSLKSRIESNELISLAKKKNLKTLMAKEDGKYNVYIYCDKENINKIYNSFVKPEVPEDYEENYNDDLNYLFNQIKDSDNQDKIIAIHIFFVELKRLVEEKKKIIKLLIGENQTHNIRKVGKLIGDKSNISSFRFQNCGDPRGMIIWNNTYLQDIRKISV